ncbi:MAG: hypothetical protein ABSE70_10490 [Candidatus Limnocylindrales bacterium]
MGSLRSLNRLGAAVALLMLVQPSVAAAAADPTPPPAPTGAISGIVTVDGVSVSGATVVIKAWPNQATLAAAKVGVAIDLPVVASATTDQSGRWAATPSAVPASHINAIGVANLMAEYTAGDSTLSWSFPLRVSTPSPATGSAAPQLGGTGASVRLRADLGTDSGVDDLDQPAAQWRGQDARRLTSAGLLRVPTSPKITPARAAAAVTSASGSGICYPLIEVLSGNYKYQIPEHFANVWSWPGVEAHLIQTQSSYHTLGVAYQASDGTWSQSGETSFTETFGAGKDNIVLGSAAISNEVNYAEYLWSPGCSFQTSTWRPVGTAYMGTPVSYYLGSQVPNWAANGCAQEPRGAKDTKTQGTNPKIALGVSFGPISLSAQAGWDSSVSEEFHYNQPSYYCGSERGGLQNSAEVQAIPAVSNATYTPLPAPVRIVDSRSPLGLTRLKSSTPQTFQVTGVKGLPTSSVVAVTGNITVTNQTAAGYVTVAPSFSSLPPATSTLNFPKGDNRANGITVQLSDTGTLAAVYMNSAGSTTDTTDIIFDVTGYFTSNMSGETYHAIQSRVYDSRTVKQPLLANSVRTIQVAGVAGVPASAAAITANVTAVAPSAPGYITIAPAFSKLPPETSTINFPAGDTRANGVTVGLNNGSVQVYFYANGLFQMTGVVLDVTGYFTKDDSGYTYHPVPPLRYVDTRIGQGAMKLLAQEKRTVTIGGWGYVPGNAVAVTGNATIVGQTAAGYLTVQKSIQGFPPETSTINFPVGDIRANNFCAPLTSTLNFTSGTVDVMYGAVAGAVTQVVMDITGYYGPVVGT